MTNQWEKINESFVELIELSSEDRQTRLKQLETMDASLAEKVSELLAKDLQNQCTRFLADAAYGPDPFQSYIDRVVEGYRIVEFVGRGAHGIVYRAESETGEVVAIKFLATDGISAGSSIELASERFKTEIDALQRLDHPNIANFISAGQLGGIPYLITEFVDGKSLGALESIPDSIDKTQIKRRIKLLTQICEAVQFAHSQIVVHRDIKPSNILLRKETAILTDFGLAKVLEDRPSPMDLTLTGQLIGTPRYMSPEQIEGRNTRNTAVDIYGLGALMYYLLTGSAPFIEEGMTQLTDRIRYADPISPRDLNSYVDSDLAKICLKCLRKEPEQRYATADDLRNDLESWLQGMPVNAGSISTWTRLLYWSKRNVAFAVLTGAFMVSLFAGVLATTTLWQSAEEQKSDLLLMVQDLVEQEKLADNRNQDTGLRIELLRLIVAALDRIESRERLSDSLFKTSAVARLKLGQLLQGKQGAEIGRPWVVEARERFQILSDRYPADVDYRFDIFHCLNSEQKNAEAYQVLKEVLAIDDSNLYHRCALSQCYLRLGTEARSDYRLEEAVDWHTKGINWTTRQSRSVEKAKPMFLEKKLAENALHRARSYFLLGNVEAGLKDLQFSEAHFQDCHQHAPKDAVICSQYCQVLFALIGYGLVADDFSAAEYIASAESVSALYFDAFPTSKDAIRARGQCLLLSAIHFARQGEKDESLRIGRDFERYLLHWGSRIAAVDLAFYRARYQAEPSIHQDVDPFECLKLLPSENMDRFAIFKAALHICLDEHPVAVSLVEDLLERRLGKRYLNNWSSTDQFDLSRPLNDRQKICALGNGILEFLHVLMLDHAIRNQNDVRTSD